MVIKFYCVKPFINAIENNSGNKRLKLYKSVHTIPLLTHNIKNVHIPSHSLIESIDDICKNECVYFIQNQSTFKFKLCSQSLNAMELHNSLKNITTWTKVELHCCKRIVDNSTYVRYISVERETLSNMKWIWPQNMLLPNQSQWQLCYSNIYTYLSKSDISVSTLSE